MPTLKTWLTTLNTYNDNPIARIPVMVSAKDQHTRFGERYVQVINKKVRQLNSTSQFCFLRNKFSRANFGILLGPTPGGENHSYDVLYPTRHLTNDVERWNVASRNVFKAVPFRKSMFKDLGTTENISLRMMKRKLQWTMKSPEESGTGHGRYKRTEK